MGVKRLLIVIHIHTPIFAPGAPPKKRIDRSKTFYRAPRSPVGLIGGLQRLMTGSLTAKLARMTTGH
jgi:hypothetical protein